MWLLLQKQQLREVCSVNPTQPHWAITGTGLVHCYSTAQLHTKTHSQTHTELRYWTSVSLLLKRQLVCPEQQVQSMLTVLLCSQLLLVSIPLIQ